MLVLSPIHCWVVRRESALTACRRGLLLDDFVVPDRQPLDVRLALHDLFAPPEQRPAAVAEAQLVDARSRGPVALDSKRRMVGGRVISEARDQELHGSIEGVLLAAGTTKSSSSRP